MGRPKASKQNTALALAFANAITIPTGPNSKKQLTEECLISEARLFQAFSSAFPSLARGSRDSREQHQSTKTAVSQIEFRKFLIKEGEYTGRSMRRRIGGLRHRWESAKFMWTNRRWVDLTDSKDLAHFEANVQAMSRLSATAIDDHILIQIAQAGSSAPFYVHQDHQAQTAESRPRQQNRDCDSDIGESGAQDTEAAATATDFRFSGCLISSRQPTNVVPRVHPPTRCFLRLRCDDKSDAAPADGGLRGLPPWSVFVANGHFQLGVSAKYLSAIFGHVPPDLRDAIIGAVAAIKVNFFTKFGRPDALRGPEGREPWTFESDGFDVEVRYTYHPVTRQLTEFYANQAYCRLVGLAPEALCAMVATHDLPDRTPQGPLHVLKPIGLRWLWPDTAPVVVQREGRLSFDVHGRNWRHTTAFRPVSPSDFDRAAARGEMQLDLRRAAGVFGSGRQLVGTLEADMRETIEGLAGCAAGRRRLGALAGEVRRAFGPAMSWAREALASGAIAGSGGRLDEAEEAALLTAHCNLV